MDDFELIKAIGIYVWITWVVMHVVDQSFLMWYIYYFFTYSDVIFEPTLELLKAILNIKFGYTPLIWTCFYKIITSCVYSSLVLNALSDLGLYSLGLSNNFMFTHMKLICWHLGHGSDTFISSSDLYQRLNFVIFENNGEFLADQFYTIIKNTEDYKFVFCTLYDFFCWYENDPSSEDCFVFFVLISWIKIVSLNRNAMQFLKN